MLVVHLAPLHLCFRKKNPLYQVSRSVCELLRQSGHLGEEKSVFFLAVIRTPIRPASNLDCILTFFFVALKPNAGYGLLIHEVLSITHNDTPLSVGLLWTNDQLVAKTSAC